MIIPETRRAPRLQVPALVPVTDQMSGAGIGRLGNISETGMLLIASEPLVGDALYQLRFPISDGQGSDQHIDVGAHLLWHEAAQAPGHAWAGFRFIALEKNQRERLRQWIETQLPAV